jgi:acetylornithine deacetylase
MDTVGVAGMSDPFQPRVSDGRLYGRGAYDMKGSLAACMLAMDDIRHATPHGDVILAAVADEEHASLGTREVLRTIRADAAIVTEPTSLQICIAHKGFSWHEITTFGKAAHGSRPDLGIDAIAHMGRVLGRIEHLQEELSKDRAHPLLGHGSLHASLISGGQELSSYPAQCTLQLERRTLPEESMETVDGQINAILQDLAASDPQFQAKQVRTLAQPPFSVPKDAPIVTALASEVSGVLGEAPAMIGASFWMDAALFAQAGIPTVVVGPHGAGAHSIEEWVDLRSVELCRQSLVRTALAFCS